MVFQAPIRYFAGSVTAVGYRSVFQELYDPMDGWRAYLIKSGPGTGKSTLLKRVYQHLVEQGEEVEVFCCSADPASLDGVCCRNRRLCVLDATAPHAVEPRYWGACEQIVSLSAGMDEETMQGQRERYIALVDEQQALASRSRRCLSAAVELLGDSYRIYRDALDTDKVVAAAARLAAREFVPVDRHGQETRRFLSAITAEGMLTFHSTIQALCPRIYVIVDDGGAVGTVLLQEVRRRALESGQQLVTCCCPLQPDSKPEHLLLPELGVAFTTSNTFHPVEYPVYRRLHASRFVDGEQLRLKRQRLSFNRRAARELLDSAVTLAAEAKEIHDQAEGLSKEAMDWSQVEAVSEDLLGKIDRLLARR